MINDLEEDVNNTALDIMNINGSYSAAQADIADMETAFSDPTTGYDAIITALNMSIAETTMTAGENTDYLADPMPSLSTQMLTSDYVFVNDSRIMLDAEMNNIATFTQCSFETLEFQLALSDVPGIAMNG